MQLAAKPCAQLKTPILKYSKEHVPLTASEIAEIEKMIIDHGRAAAVRRDRGQKGIPWKGTTILDTEVADALKHSLDRAIALRN
jgi:hypothetical protein